MNLLRRFYRAMLQFRASATDDNGRLGILLKVTDDPDFDSEDQAAQLGMVIQLLRSYNGPGTICMGLKDLTVFSVVVENNGWVVLHLVTQSEGMSLPLFNTGRPNVQAKSYEIADEGLIAKLCWSPSAGTLEVSGWSEYSEQEKPFILIGYN